MANRNISVIVTLTDEQYEDIALYQGQFLRDLPETEQEKDNAIEVFVQDLVEQWIDYYNDESDDGDDGFDEVGELTIQ